MKQLRPTKPVSIQTTDEWPPDYREVFAWRQRQLTLMRRNPAMLRGAKLYYREHKAEFINHWLDTYDPRNSGRGKLARMPFVLFPRQRELVHFIDACIRAEEGGLVEKCRDAGVTWVCAGYSVALFLFQDGAAVGWGSRKEALVDKIGDPDSIFEKMRMMIRGLPREFLPHGFTEDKHMTYMKMVNPENDATITGEAGNNIGRGGRKLVYFKDESAHYEKPVLIEAALGDNTRTQIDVSSVNGLGNVFHRRREAGEDWTGGEITPGRTGVFVFDWRDHPEKDQAWYDKRRQKSEDDGLLSVFEQEVNRNYAASVEGIIIKPEWIESCIDAHTKLGIEVTGQRMAALDVADEGLDTNALTIRRGILLESVDQWGDRDTGVTTRQTAVGLEGLGDIEVQYDCIGVGAGVKSEANRLREEGLLDGVTFVPWAASAGPQFPDAHVVDDDEESPINGDFHRNLKSQAWWEFQRKCYKTHRAVTEGIHYPEDELVSISSDIPQLQRLKKELCQVTWTRSTSTLKLLVNKTPDGTKSPNMADSVVMNYWPIITSTYTLENL